MYVHLHNFITPNITFLILATFQCLQFYLYGTGPLTMTVSGGSGVWPTTYFSKSAEEGVVIQEAVTLDIAPQDSTVVSFFFKDICNIFFALILLSIIIDSLFYFINVCLISKTKKHHRNAVNFNKCCEANLQLNSLLKCLFH